MIELRDFIDLYYNSDPKKARAWHVERKEAVTLFVREFGLRRYLPNPLLTSEEIEKMLEAGEGHVLGLPVVLSADKSGVWLEVNP